MIFHCLSAGQTIPGELPGLKEQLMGVNKNWTDERIAKLKSIWGVSVGDQLIKLHLQLVEEILSGETKPHLTVEQKKRRSLGLQRLKQYWQRGKFPINSFHTSPQPYFVDRIGTHCAVAYLMAESGATELVNEIKGYHNFSYIEEMQKQYPEISLWAENNGFSVDELKWIQPVYPPPPQDVFPMGNGGGANGPVHVMKVDPDGSLLYLAGEFTTIDNIQANSIVAWDGEQWSTLGMGIDGVIYDIHFHSAKLHIAGNFKIHGEEDYSSIAYWDDDQWIAMQYGNTGDIYTLETYQDKLYIGGGFQHLNNTEMPFLAYFDEQTGNWSNNGYALDVDSLVSVPGMFSVDDTVRSLAVYDDLLFVGGHFSLTSPGVNHPNVIQYEVDNYATWFAHQWIPGLANDFHSINLIEPIGDSLYLIGPMIGGYDFMQIYYGGSFLYTETACWVLNDDAPPLIHGYVQHNSKDYFYGNIDPHLALNGGGLYHHIGQFNGAFDDQIRASANFNDQLYFAGDFTAAFGQPLNGLAYSSWGDETVEVEDNSYSEQNNIDFFVDQKQLWIKSAHGIHSSEVNIYTLSGQRVKSVRLDGQSRTSTIDLKEIPAGAYVFQISSPHFHKSSVFTIY